MNKLEELGLKAKVEELLQKVKKQEEIVETKKKPNILLIVLGIVGFVVAVAGIAYAVYRYLTPDYLDEFEDEFEDDEFEEDFLDEEE